MSKDEAVNGAAIAARILNYLPQSNRERILKKMVDASPRSTALVLSELSELPKETPVSPTSKIVNPEIAPLAAKIAAALKKLLASDDATASGEVLDSQSTRRVDPKSANERYKQSASRANTDKNSE